MVVGYVVLGLDSGWSCVISFENDDGDVGCSGCCDCICFIVPTVTTNFEELQNGHAFCCVFAFIVVGLL